MTVFPPRFVRAAAVVVFTALAAPVWAQTPPASQVLNTAVKTAKASNKNILVHFGASW